MTASTLTPVETGPPAPGHRPAQRALLWAGGVLGAVLIAWCALQAADVFATTTETVDHDYGAARTVELVADGPVTVTAGGDDAVLVTERNRTGFGSSTYTADLTSQDGEGSLVVESRCNRWWGSSTSCAAGLDVTVPAGTAVLVRSSSGDVAVSDVAGTVDVSAGDGRVLVAGAGGDVLASTVSGGVSVDGVDGDLVASTLDGAVEVARVTGDVVASSGSGQVSVDGGRQVEARTTDGAVTVTATRGPVVAVSGSGAVEVQDAGGDVEAKSTDGAVTVQRVAGSAVASSGSGRVEVGAVRDDVEATSSDGAVTVRGTDEPAVLTIVTSDGRTTVEGATDPKATRAVVIRSGSGDVAYLGPR
ncbi:DUF4097 family beta strand repeat-containing protein [Cellulomonas sp. P22]|uniref:DUF4097 family beta strand repeat-containing protein n=1 Tax=Cellulomonas sp. P22 TaxID=3373189 RepID=UPI0037AB4C51